MKQPLTLLTSLLLAPLGALHAADAPGQIETQHRSDPALAAEPTRPESASPAAGSLWSAEKANAWYSKQPWPCGFNYLPSHNQGAGKMINDLLGIELFAN